MSYFNKYIWVAPTRKCNKHNCSSYLKEYSPRKRGGVILIQNFFHCSRYCIPRVSGGIPY